jgi:hypothetical protein
MEIPSLLGNYRNMITLASDKSIKETLIMQKFAMVNTYKDKLSDMPSLRQKLYLEAVNWNVENPNCKDQLELWIEHCESLGHGPNFTTQSQSWD